VTFLSVSSSVVYVLPSNKLRAGVAVVLTSLIMLVTLTAGVAFVPVSTGLRVLLVTAPWSVLSITDAPTPVHNLAEIMDRQMDEFENDHRHQDPKDPGTRLLLTR
jgi:hypothetical protein